MVVGVGWEVGEVEFYRRILARQCVARCDSGCGLFLHKYVQIDRDVHGVFEDVGDVFEGLAFEVCGVLVCAGAAVRLGELLDAECKFGGFEPQVVEELESVLCAVGGGEDCALEVVGGNTFESVERDYVVAPFGVKTRQKCGSGGLLSHFGVACAKTSVIVDSLVFFGRGLQQCVP